MDKNIDNICDSANRHEDMLRRLDERQAQHSCTLDLLTLKHADRLEALEERLEGIDKDLTQFEADVNHNVSECVAVRERLDRLEALEERLEKNLKTFDYEERQ